MSDKLYIKPVLIKSGYENLSNRELKEKFDRTGSLSVMVEVLRRLWDDKMFKDIQDE